MADSQETMTLLRNVLPNTLACEPCWDFRKQNSVIHGGHPSALELSLCFWSAHHLHRTVTVFSHSSGVSSLSSIWQVLAFPAHICFWLFHDSLPACFFT